MAKLALVFLTVNHGTMFGIFDQTMTDFPSDIGLTPILKSYVYYKTELPGMNWVLCNKGKGNFI